ncbi:MAG: hypothetical protein QOE70_2999 [Chthoniobacter sp.]|jgi:uncharacterized membrane protein|nr:hypothetical protein [Chthoniobacter sp.]
MNRRSLLLPLAVLGLACLGLAGYVWCSAPQLPERVATHFGLHGEPNGWMSRGGYVQFTIAFGLGLPGFLLLIFALIRAANGKGLNIPNREHWLAPERREETLSFMGRHGAWLACLMVGFFAGLHHLIIVANVSSPPSLPNAQLGLMVSAFLGAVAIWVVVLYRRFSRPA